MAARIPLEVGNAHIENLRVILVPPYPLSGKMTLEGPPLALERPFAGLSVLLEHDAALPDRSTQIPSNVNADGSFTFRSVIQGDYRVYVPPILKSDLRFANFVGNVFWNNPVPGFEDTYVKAIRLGGTDFLAEKLTITSAPENPLEVVLGQGGSLRGAVTDSGLRPSVNVTVVLVPAVQTSRLDLFRVAVSDRLGSFQIRGIAPGDYRAFAWEDVAEGVWHDAEFMRSAEARGKPVHIGEGMQTETELIVISK
jgi:hypothetical protein